MKRLLLIILTLSLALSSALGQNPIKVKAPNLVDLNEQFNITFEIQGEGKIDSFKWEPGDDFQLVWGPQEGSSSSTSIINGKVSRSVTKSYTYVLIPKKIGHFTLSPATVKIDGKNVNSDEPAIEVVAEQNSQRNSSQDPNQTGNISDEDVFLKLHFSKTKMMVGEPVVATLKLYQRVSIAGLEKGKFPEFDGFWSQESAPDNIEFQRESINGAIYQSALIRSWTLIPQRAGEHIIPSSELICVINVRVPRASTGSIFDDFFHDDFRTVRKRVVSSPTTLKVEPLPSGAPASFGGGVGNFNMDVELGKDTLHTHEASSLIITIKGKGNLSLLEAPKIHFPSDFEVYDVKASEINGGKTFEYPFIPRSHGDFTIDPIEYAYYDITDARYKTLTSNPLSINVQKGSDQTSSGPNIVSSGVQRKDVKNIASDIRYIHSAKPKFKATVGAFFVLSPAFGAIVLALFVLAFGLYFVLRSLARRRSDVVASKNRAAEKMARRRLTTAEQFLKKQLYSAFYEELHKALLGYASDKLNLDSNDMSKDIISQRFTNASVNEALVKDFVALLDECEFARYAPAANNDAMNVHFENALNVISSIEAAMKKNSKKLNIVATSIVALLFISPIALSAQDVDTLWNEGVEAYSAGDWSLALDSWLEIENEGASDAKLYYNIAGAYFKNDQIAKAILYYEKCLLLDPAHKDAQFNLELANSMIQDRIEVLPEFFLVKWMRELSWSLNSDAWAAISLIMLSLALAMVLVFLLGNSVKARKIGFSIAIVALVICLSTFALSLNQRNRFRKADTAIVMRPVCNVKSSPSDMAAKDLFVIHEGTKIKLLDKLGAWSNIELSDGRQGWMLSADMEVISPLAL